MINFTYSKKNNNYFVKIEEVGYIYNTVLYEQSFNNLYSMLKYNPLILCNDYINVVYDKSIMELIPNKYLNLL
jgi:hypothetical protein